MGKKNKKQKALEEKRRQEEELLRQQQEEERQRQEELERQRQEEEEKQRLLREKRRQEEQVRLSQETEDDKSNIQKYEDDLKQLEHEEKEQSEWKKHLRCDETPDVYIDKDLNDFLTVWRDPASFQHRELSKNPLDEIQSVVASCNEAYSLKKSIFERYFRAMKRENQVEMQICMEYMSEIVQISASKLDELSLRCLRHDSFTSVGSDDVEIDEMSRGVAFEDDGLEFGLWSSGMRNAFRNKKVQINDLNVDIELPKQVAMKAQMALGCRIIGLKDLVNFENRGDFEPIAKVYDIMLVKLPQHPHTIQVSSSSGGHESNVKPNDDAASWRVQREEVEMISMQPWDYGQNLVVDENNREEIRVTMKLNDLLVIEMQGDDAQPKPGWWCQETSSWCDTDFGDVTFDESKNELSFVTCHLRPLSVVIPRGTDCNYKSWMVSPSGVERCKVTLSGQRFDVEIEVVGGECQLIQPNIPQLMDIIHRQMKPHQLVATLASFGIRICPRDNDLAEQHPKDYDVEMKAYREISTSATSFEVSSSGWNGEVGPDIVVFQMRKPLTPNEEADMDSSRMHWMTCMINREKCSFVDCKHTQQEFCDDPPAHESSHTTLLKCLAPHSTEDFTRDLAHTSFRFQQTVRSVLTLTRPLYK